MHRLAGITRLSAMMIVALILASCSTQFRNHGYAPSDADLANIIVGTDDRETVASLIGPPTASGVLDDSSWYYVESRFRHYAYQAPKEISRQVVAISFDASGRVANIERFGLEDGRIIALSRRVTKSAIDEKPFLRRLLGNLGAPSAAGFL